MTADGAGEESAAHAETINTFHKKADMAADTLQKQRQLLSDGWLQNPGKAQLYRGLSAVTSQPFLQLMLMVRSPITSNIACRAASSILVGQAKHQLAW